MGDKTQQELETQLKAQASGAQAPCEAISEVLSALPLAIAADVVMVLFRPTRKHPREKSNGEKSKSLS